MYKLTKKKTFSSTMMVHSGFVKTVQNGLAVRCAACGPDFVPLINVEAANPIESILGFGWAKAYGLKEVYFNRLGVFVRWHKQCEVSLGLETVYTLSLPSIINECANQGIVLKDD